MNETSVSWSYEEFTEHRHDILKNEEGREYIWTDGGAGNARYKRFVDDGVAAGKPLDSVWDLPLLNSSDKQRKGYITQNPENLLERILKACSKPHDLVFDCFIGSGTTAAVAQKLGRRWIGCDINKGAIQTTSRRLQSILTEQINAQNKSSVRKEKSHSKLDVDDTAGEIDMLGEKVLETVQV